MTLTQLSNRSSSESPRFSIISVCIKNWEKSAACSQDNKRLKLMPCREMIMQTLFLILQSRCFYSGLSLLDLSGRLVIPGHNFCHISLTDELTIHLHILMAIWTWNMQRTVCPLPRVNQNWPPWSKVWLFILTNNVQLVVTWPQKLLTSLTLLVKWKLLRDHWNLVVYLPVIKQVSEEKWGGKQSKWHVSSFLYHKWAILSPLCC